MPLEGFIHIVPEYLYPYAKTRRKIGITATQRGNNNTRKITTYNTAHYVCVEKFSTQQNNYDRCRLCLSYGLCFHTCKRKNTLLIYSCLKSTRKDVEKCIAPLPTIWLFSPSFSEQSPTLSWRGKITRRASRRTILPNVPAAVSTNKVLHLFGKYVNNMNYHARLMRAFSYANI